MKKKIIPLLFFFLASYVGHAVSIDDPAPPAVATASDDPDTYLSSVENYLSFVTDSIRMDYLYNLKDNSSGKFHKMKKIDWNSLLRKDVVFLYAIRINQSRFALCPGVGWSSLFYPFAGEKHGDEIIYPKLKRTEKSRTDCQDLENNSDIKYSYSAVKISFIDLLLRLRFNSVLDDPKAGFHTWLGVKFGFRKSASSIVEYKEYGDSPVSYVEEGSFNLKPYAWAFQAGVGYGRFGLTGAFYCTSLFEGKQGPTDADSLRPFSLGIYVDLL